MGYGDYLMALGDAENMHSQDPRRSPVAIGDGRRVEDLYPDLRFGLNFIATQAVVDSGAPVNWVISFHGVRPYHDYEAMRELWEHQHPWRRRLLGSTVPSKLVRRLGHYLYNHDYRATPAPVVLTEQEQLIAREWSQRRFVVIEPSIKQGASPSKRWPFERYASVAQALSREIEVYQIGAKCSPPIKNVPRLETSTFRDVLPYLKAAQLYIGPEGGLHHASAAMGTRAVVLFGGYTPPSITGYDFHVNLTGGVAACGTHTHKCQHCVEAMNRISIDEVLTQARMQLMPHRIKDSGESDCGTLSR